MKKILWIIVILTVLGVYFLRNIEISYTLVDKLILPIGGILLIPIAIGFYWILTGKKPKF